MWGVGRGEARLPAAPLPIGSGLLSCAVLSLGLRWACPWSPVLASAPRCGVQGLQRLPCSVQRRSLLRA